MEVDKSDLMIVKQRSIAYEAVVLCEARKRTHGNFQGKSKN